MYTYKRAGIVVQHVGVLAILSVLFAGSESALAQTIDPFYAGAYTFSDLGSIAGVPPSYGGLTFKFDDPNVILIGGAANEAPGALYSVGVVRDIHKHIIGFSGPASFYADAAFNDGGVDYGPSHVLFLARWPNNEIGQTKAGSAVTDKIIDLTPFGVVPSPGGGTFVPIGFAGAGHYKMVSWEGGEWYDSTVTPDGSGTFDFTTLSAVPGSTLPGGPEGFVYVPLASPLFGTPSILLSAWSIGELDAYEIDGNGDPIVATGKLFMSGLDGAEGAVLDPMTGDFLFSTFGGGDRVIVVQGFSRPVPEPSMLAMLSIAAIVGSLGLKRRKR